MNERTRAVLDAQSHDNVREDIPKGARMAIIATHPIPYYVPLYRALARQGNLDVRAFFASRVGLDNTVDPGMGVEIAWKTDLLSGYQQEFLPGAEKIRTTHPREVDNPGVGASLARFRPDVLLMHGYMWRTAMRALAWCRYKHVPAMMISDGSLHSGTGAFKAWLKAAILPTVFSQYDAFLCIGDANQQYFETFAVPRAHIFRVPIMVDEGFWNYRKHRDTTRAAIRAELGLSEGELAVLFVGKLISRKRPGDLLEALKQLEKLPPTVKRVRVLFAGDGDLRSELQTTAARAQLPAQFLGFVNIDRLPAYYCAADVLAHPAEIETFGVIAVEAAILALPLVLSDHVGAIGPTSIARPGKNALVYPCGDVAALAQALWRMASEPDLVSRLSSASLEISEELDGKKSVSGALEAVRYCLSNRIANRRQQPRRQLP